LKSDEAPTCSLGLSSFNGLLELHVEGEGQEVGEGHRTQAVDGGEEDGGVGGDEFGEYLTACAAGWTGGAIEVGDGHGSDADVRTELGDGADEGGSLGADGEAVADILNIGAGDDFACREKEGCADAEAGVGRVGVEGGFAGLLHQIFERWLKRVRHVHRISPRSFPAGRVRSLRLMHLRFSCIAMVAVAAGMALTFTESNSQAGRAQIPAVSHSEAAANSPVFDVAAIRQNNSDHTARSHIYYSPGDGSFRAINVPMKMLLQFAFGLPETRIIGGPDWLSSIKFDVDAKADSSIDARMSTLSGDDARQEKQKMVRALLADRFKLIDHMETRELPIYILAPAKGGSKLQPSKSNGTTVDSWNNKIDVRGGDNTVALLAEELSKRLGRVVIDKTGIQGRYDILLNWTPDDGAAGPLNGGGGISAAADSGPSIFTAIQEQLGLKLESQKGPVEVLVIDSVDMPSAN
jgi:uncharacterized protein (TIGR03435 family)